VHAVDQYILRVLADQWATPARTASLLDVSRHGDGIADELARVGFRVTRVRLDDSSLETVSERLAGVHRLFDTVIVRDVLEVVEDWREVVNRAARRLRPGGVFVYGVTGSGAGPLPGRFMPGWLRSRIRPAIPAGELVAMLRRSGLLPREIVPLGPDALEAVTAAHMGYSIRRVEPSSTAFALRWDFVGTGERWLAGVREEAT
jgi:SAM-dependent methyltransferase